jgi:hypothetical protein
VQTGLTNGFQHFEEACCVHPQDSPRRVSPERVLIAENEVIRLQQQASGSGDKCTVYVAGG